MQKQSSLSDHSGKFRIRYEEQLNFPQLQAVTTTQGPLLVIAGAGSGKTRTLTYRVARLVEDGVSPASILLLTFTRKAAQQMLLRAAELLDRRCEGVAGGTFHSFGNITLRKYASALGINPGFAILDRIDAEALISILRKETGQHKHRRHIFNRHLRGYPSDAFHDPFGQRIGMAHRFYNMGAGRAISVTPSFV
jgi:DNA helicase-2/ATP-dependent DNA helicase PcrA